MRSDTGILNKDIFWDYTLVSCLMNEWDDDWHCYSSAPRSIRHIFCIFFLYPSIHRLEAHLRKAHWWGDSLCVGSRVLVIREWLLLYDFLFPVLSLHCESRSFVLLIEFLWFDRLKEALWSLDIDWSNKFIKILLENLIWSKGKHSSSSRRSSTWFRYVPQVSSMSFDFLMFFPWPNLLKKTLVRSRRNHWIDLHWESANLAIWVLCDILKTSSHSKTSSLDSSTPF